MNYDLNSEIRYLQEENDALRAEIAGAKAMDSRTARLGLPFVGLAGLYALVTNTPPDNSPLVETAQETIAQSARTGVVDLRAEAAMAKYFPGALSSLATDRIVSRVLAKRGYNRDNTLFATSTCPVRCRLHAIIGLQ